MGSNTSRLHSAVLESNLRVLKNLVEKRGVDVETEFPAQNCATSEQYKDKLVVVRAIHVAARHGNDIAMEFLLNELGAYEDPVSGVGDTPLMLAARHNHLRCIYLLLIAGADSTTENFDGKNALQIAEESESREALQCLRGERTEVPITDESARLASIGVYSISSQDIRNFLTGFA